MPYQSHSSLLSDQYQCGVKLNTGGLHIKFSAFDHRVVRVIKLLYEDRIVALDRKLEVARNVLESFQSNVTAAL